MNEPYNVFDVGVFKGSVAFGKSVHRMLSQLGALNLAYWLIRESTADTPETQEARSRILTLLVQQGKEGGD